MMISRLINPNISVIINLNRSIINSNSRSISPETESSNKIILIWWINLDNRVIAVKWNNPNNRSIRTIQIDSQIDN